MKKVNENQLRILQINVPMKQECLIPDCEKKAFVTIGYDSKTYSYFCNECGTKLISNSNPFNKINFQEEK